MSTKKTPKSPEHYSKGIAIINSTPPVKRKDLMEEKVAFAIDLILREKKFTEIQQAIMSVYDLKTRQAATIIQRAHEKMEKMENPSVQKAAKKMVMQYDMLFEMAVAAGDYTAAKSIQDSKKNLLGLDGAIKIQQATLVQHQHQIDFSQYTEEQIESILKLLNPPNASAE